MSQGPHTGALWKSYKGACEAAYYLQKFIRQNKHIFQVKVQQFIKFFNLSLHPQCFFKEFERLSALLRSVYSALPWICRRWNITLMQLQTIGTESITRLLRKKKILGFSVIKNSDIFFKFHISRRLALLPVHKKSQYPEFDFLRSLNVKQKWRFRFSSSCKDWYFTANVKHVYLPPFRYMTEFQALLCSTDLV